MLADKKWNILFIWLDEYCWLHQKEWLFRNYINRALQSGNWLFALLLASKTVRVMNW